MMRRFDFSAASTYRLIANAGSTTIAAPELGSPTRYDAQPRSSSTNWRNSTNTHVNTVCGVNTACEVRSGFVWPSVSERTMAVPERHSNRKQLERNPHVSYRPVGDGARAGRVARRGRRVRWELEVVLVDHHGDRGERWAVDGRRQEGRHCPLQPLDGHRLR